MLVECPRCRRQTQFEGNPWRPFCSQRCKLIDLGQWADESFRIPVENDDGEGETANPADETDS